MKDRGGLRKTLKKRDHAETVELKRATSLQKKKWSPEKRRNNWKNAEKQHGSEQRAHRGREHQG